MSVAAPLPPTSVPATSPPGVTVPEIPPVLELLLASRPEQERRVVASSFAIAVGLHLLLLLLLLILGPLGGHWRPTLPVSGNPEEQTVTLLLPGTDLRGAGAALAPARAPARGAESRLITPRRIPTSIPPLPSPGAEQGAGAQPGAPGAEGAGNQPGAGGASGAATAAGRFRPHSWDRRLWEPPDALAPTESEGDRVANRVQGRVDAVNDSAAAVADAARKATDWTIKGKNGGEWGVTPGKLHLGSLTLPLPLYFNTPPGQRDAAEREQANWEEIQRSASQAEIHHTFDERVKAIRDRKEKERQDQQKKKDETTTSSSSN